MSDDQTKPPASPLSTPASTASLDDVLSSLENQVQSSTSTQATPTPPSPDPVPTPPIPVELTSIPEPVTDTTSPASDTLAMTSPTSTLSEPSTIAESTPVTTPSVESVPTATEAPASSSPMEAVAPVVPAPTPEVSSFGIEEKHVTSSDVAPSVPVATSVSMDALREHPAMKVDTAVPSPSLITPPENSTPPKKAGLFGLSFSPKIAIAGVIALFLIIGSVAAFMLSQSNQDLRQRAAVPSGYTNAKDCSFHGDVCKCTFCRPENAVDCIWDGDGSSSGGRCGGGGSGPTNPPGASTVCYAGSPTASSCRNGNTFGSPCTGFAGTCQKGQLQSNGQYACACIPNTALPNGSSCTANANCQSGYCNPSTHKCESGSGSLPSCPSSQCSTGQIPGSVACKTGTSAPQYCCPSGQIISNGACTSAAATPGTGIGQGCLSGEVVCNCATGQVCKPNPLGASYNIRNGVYCYASGTTFSCQAGSSNPGIDPSATRGGACNPTTGNRGACGSQCAQNEQLTCNGTTYVCTKTDACAVQPGTGGSVTPGGSCNGLTRVSAGEPSNGGFVGCYGQLNCFCPGNISVGQKYTSGTVACLPDVGNDSCGAPGRTPAPAVCGSTCTSGDGKCEKIGMVCSSGVCRNPSCTGSSNCVCPTNTPNPTPKPSPTPVPACNSVCTTNAQCPTGLVCSSGKCRKSTCLTSTTCVCPTPTPSPTPVPSPGACNARCSTDANCTTGYCYQPPMPSCPPGAACTQVLPPKVCRNRACSTSATCTCTTPSPSPTPTPPPLACLRITRDIASPKLGNQVRFTCGQVAGADRYEFRYKYAFNGGAEIGGTLTAVDNLSSPLTIEQPGAYKVQCRVCVGQACSEWERW